MKRAALVMLGLALIIAGCTSTKLINTWQTENPPTAPLAKIMVAGISQQEVVRRSFEDHFSQQLIKAGVDAVQGYKLIPVEVEKDPEAVKKAARAAGCDGVLAVHYKGTETREEYVPGRTVPTYFGGYYPYVYGYVHEPGYYVKRNYLSLESNLYQLSDGRLLWAATSETYEPSSIEKLVGDLASLVIEDLKKAGFIN